MIKSGQEFAGTGPVQVIGNRNTMYNKKPNNVALIFEYYKMYIRNQIMMEHSTI